VHTTQGDAGLGVPGNAWIELWSAAFESSAVPDGESLLLDVYIPAPTSSGGFGGQVDVSVDCPSAGLWTQYVGWQSLQGRSFGAFNTLGFRLPENVRTALNGAYADCRVRITVNSWGAGGALAFDNLRVGQADFCSTAQLSSQVPFVLNSAVTPDGTSARPYPICTSRQLQTIADSPWLWNSHFELRTSLDVSSLTSSLGTATNPFRGTFHGGGHTLSGLEVQRVEGVGLFGRIEGDGILDGSTDGYVHDLVLHNPEVSGASRVGALAGSVHNGRVERCQVRGGTVTGSVQVGGLLGELSGNSSVVEVSASAAVVGDGAHVGGLIGRVIAGTLWRGTASGPVQGLGSVSAVGGLVGWSSGVLVQGYVLGETSVTGSGQHVGGLLGWGAAQHSVAESQGSGNVSAASASSVGGLVGSNSGSISGSFATGAVFGGTSVGGLAGASGGDVTEVFATGSVFGQDVGGAFGLLTGDATRVFASGSVAGLGGACGGFAGRATGPAAHVADAFATGDVACAPAVSAGGFVGTVSGGARIQRTYARGTVTAAGDVVGAFTGLVDGAGSSVASSFFHAAANVSLDGVAITVGSPAVSLAGLSTSQFAEQAPFAASGWDFASVWSVGPEGVVLQ
jgi:hypothetical protein